MEAFKKVTLLSDPAQFKAFEAAYLRVREQEGRLLSDPQVLALPRSPGQGSIAREWRWRARSFARLKRYIARKKCHRILDLGCGNGWMSGRLAAPDRTLWAMDVNLPELEQGARLFGAPGLAFYFGDIRSVSLPENHFDLIILSASAQYFRSLDELTRTLLPWLADDGEIHITDTPFYPTETAAEAARQRTRAYYQSVEAPEMAGFYHHHTLPRALELGWENLNRPLLIRLLQKCRYHHSFPWLAYRTQSR